MTASAWLICLFGSSRHLPSGPVARRAAGLAQPSSTAYLPAIMVLGLRGRRESVRIDASHRFLQVRVSSMYTTIAIIVRHTCPASPVRLCPVPFLGDRIVRLSGKL